MRQDGASASELRSGIHATNTHLSEPGQPGGGNSPVYWPRDLLPDKIPDARIYTWGYDADIDALSSASRNTIHQHAVTLLSDLVDLRKESEYNRKPIIFVVHSLGGIVVKAALNLSRSTEGTQVKEIAPITAGVCFLGTPHRGSNTATIGKIAFQITKAAGKSPNTKILQGLERNSETLDMIGDDFIQTMLKYGSNMKVYSFREEKRTKKWPLRSIMVRSTPHHQPLSGYLLFSVEFMEAIKRELQKNPWYNYSLSIHRLWTQTPRSLDMGMKRQAVLRQIIVI